MQPPANPAHSAGRRRLCPALAQRKTKRLLRLLQDHPLFAGTAEVAHTALALIVRPTGRLVRCATGATTSLESASPRTSLELCPLAVANNSETRMRSSQNSASQAWEREPSQPSARDPRPKSQ